MKHYFIPLSPRLWARREVLRMLDSVADVAHEIQMTDPSNLVLLGKLEEGLRRAWSQLERNVRAWHRIESSARGRPPLRVVGEREAEAFERAVSDTFGEDTRFR
jgi:hypothetical protein